jgi:hypothetical protein
MHLVCAPKQLYSCDQAYHLNRFEGCRRLKSLDEIRHCINLKKLDVSGLMLLFSGLEI